MEIKTLAQILEENPTRPDYKTAERSSRKKQQRNSPVKRQSSLKSQRCSQHNDKPRQQSNKSARGFATPKNSEEVLLQDPSNNSDYRHKTHKKIKQNNKKKNRFHPASPYKPQLESCTPTDKSHFAEVNPNTVKTILTQLKAEHINNDANLQKYNSDFDINDDIVSYTDTDINNNINTDQSIDCNHLSGVEIDNTNVGNPSLSNTFLNDTDSNNYGSENTESKSIESNNTASIDNLPVALKAYLKTPEQRQAEKEEIKANSRLRWLAFYYLSRREHSQGELRQKLLDKEQDPDKIEALLQEFSEKGYQSDYRTALMLIREGIRKRRGRMRIKNDFYKRKVTVPVNIDELIDMAMTENEAFVDVMSDNDLVEGVDWLQLAVEARVKKYGNNIPTEPKEKARQLRFLQYRGFKPDICFEAITLNLDNIDDRF